MARFPQNRFELGFEIKRNEKGELKVYLYEPVLNFYGLELPGALERKGDEYVLGSYETSFRLMDPDGRHFVSGAQVVFGSFDHFVYAVGRKTGQQVWKADTYAEVDGSPALIDGKIVLDNHGSLVEALDPTTGKPVWRRITCMEPKDGRVVWWTDVCGWAWARPFVTGNIAYVGTGRSEPYQMGHLPAMTALDRTTGLYGFPAD